MEYMKSGTTYLVAAEFLGEIMDEEEITFVLLASYRAKIKNRKRWPKHRYSFADAFFLFANIGEDHSNHRRYYHIE